MQRFLVHYKIISLNFILICSIIYGFICKLLIEINLNLNSDTVLAGILSMEISRHKNYNLDNIYLPSANPYIFSDILPFHLVPQIISDFNPLCLKVVTYFIYVLIVVNFSYIVYKLTGKNTNALLFASFMANISSSYLFSFMGSSFYLEPTHHNATVLFTGFFILTFLNINPVYIEYKTNLSPIIASFLLILIVFSDAIILAWFVIPITICYFICYGNKRTSSMLLIIFINISSIITYIFTPHIVKHFISFSARNIGPRDISEIITQNIPLFFEGVSRQLSLNFHNISTEFVILELIYILSFSIVIFSIVKYIICGNNCKSVNYMYIYLLTSATAIFLGYIIVMLSADLFTSRYLMFTGLSIFMLISMIYGNHTFNRKLSILYKLSAFSILFYMIVVNSIFVTNMNIYNNSNENEYALINYLDKNNLTYGIGDYWDSNLITYLSNEQVIIRPVDIHNGMIYPFRWMACENWFNSSLYVVNAYFIITGDNNVFLKQEEIEKMMKITNYSGLTSIRKFNNYLIYVFDGPIPYEQFSCKHIYEAEELFSQSGQIIPDVNSSGGFCIFAAYNESGIVVYGPYVRIPNGVYIASFKIKSNNCNSSKPLVRLDVATSAGREIIAEKELFLSDFEYIDNYQSFDILFNSQGQNNFEFRVFKYPQENLWVDQISVTELLQE